MKRVVGIGVVQEHVLTGLVEAVLDAQIDAFDDVHRQGRRRADHVGVVTEDDAFVVGVLDAEIEGEGAADVRPDVADDRPQIEIVAAVQGPVAGGGLGFMLVADLIVASESATFSSRYSDVGLTPDCGVSWLLPESIGARRALELVLTRRTLTAAEAHEWGLVNEVVAPEAVADRFSSAYLLAVASKLVQDVASLRERARAARKPLATLTLKTEIRFATPASRQAFTEELAAAIAGLVAKHHDAQDEGGRRFALVVGAHPVPLPESAEPPP